jgi:hypothetical protein
MNKLGKARLESMVEEATTDCHDEDEQSMGLFTMIEENLQLPFETVVLGLPVVVEKIDIRRRDEIVAICRHRKHRQAVPILDLPIPTPPPPGAEWIEAFRHFMRHS